MRINECRIKNYGIHADSVIEFKPVTILMGRNGGGKSAVIESLLTLSRLSRQPVESVFQESGPYSFVAKHSHGTPLTEPIEFAVTFVPPEYVEAEEYSEVRYSVAVSMGESGVYLSSECLTDRNGDVVFERVDGKLEKGPSELAEVPSEMSVMAFARRLDGRHENLRGIKACGMSLRRILRFRFNPISISQDGDLYTEEEDDGTAGGQVGGRQRPAEPALGFYGENVAGFLYWLQDFAGPDFRRVQSKLAELVPGFERIMFSTAGPDPNKVGWEARYSDHRGLVPSRNLSSGTLSLLALLCVTEVRGGSQQPKVFCIEEPEMGLTPEATRAMFDYLAGSLNYNSQLIVTTHSPHLWHPRIKDRDGSVVVRLLPNEKGVSIESAEEALIREQGNAELAKLRDEGGLGVSAALKLMEGLG